MTGLLLLSITTTCLSVNVSAAEAQFDPAFYAVTYQDVVVALGTDSQVLYNHYLTYGMKEGRLPFNGATPGQSVNGIVQTAATDAKFDPAFYAATYQDVAAALGTDSQVLYNHYLTYGMKEGRLPFHGAAPGQNVNGIVQPFTPVPLKKLANYKSIKKKMTDAEFQQAYDVALQIVTPFANMSREDQLTNIAIVLRERFDNGMTYSMSDAHYNDPYGYFILGTASCAGCTRATGLCLNILGISYEHVNEGAYSHQWCRVNLNGTYWICDAFGLYVGPEPAPYQHPYL